MFGSAVNSVRNDAPALTGDFSLVPVEERLQWRDALSLHLLHQMRSPSGFPLPKWKIEEQVVPMNLVVAGLLEQGIVADPQILEERFGTEGTIRSDYASGK